MWQQFLVIVSPSFFSYKPNTVFLNCDSFLCLWSVICIRLFQIHVLLVIYHPSIYSTDSVTHVFLQHFNHVPLVLHILVIIIRNILIFICWIQQINVHYVDFGGTMALFCRCFSSPNKLGYLDIFDIESFIFELQVILPAACTFGTSPNPNIHWSSLWLFSPDYTSHNLQQTLIYSHAHHTKTPTPYTILSQGCS